MSEVETEPTRPLEVWMDGQCALCRASQAWCEQRDPGGRFRFRDFRAVEESELPLDTEQHEASMWVRDGDGRLLRGFDAWRRMMATLPGWRWLAALSGLPPLRWLGEPVYRLIARNRHRLPGLRS